MTTKVGIPSEKPCERLVAPPGSELRNVLLESAAALPHLVANVICKCHMCQDTSVLLLLHK